MTWIPDTNELAPGVTIERRAIFFAPLAVAAAVLRAAQPARAANTPSAGPAARLGRFHPPVPRRRRRIRPRRLGNRPGCVSAPHRRLGRAPQGRARYQAR